jgi:hypothetical protein
MGVEMSCDPNQLLESSKCFQCLDEKQLKMVIAYLLCQISTGSGTSGKIQTISTVDADPNTAAIVPADPTKAALFYQDPSVVGGIYNVWHWSITNQTWVQYSSP